MIEERISQLETKIVQRQKGRRLKEGHKVTRLENEAYYKKGKLNTSTHCAPG